MGTTLTLAYTQNDVLYVAHVGDSRCYLFRRGILYRLTRDHTLVEEMVQAGALKAEEVKSRLGTPEGRTMNPTLEAIPVPLRDDGHGGLRVGQTRVSLESVWHLHQQGDSPADIVRAFGTLQLADVHAVLAWRCAIRKPWPLT